MSENAPEKPQVITISTATLVKVAIFVLAGVFLYLIRDIIALFFVSLMLASIINPLASWFQARRMPRGVAVLLLYVLILGLLAAIVTLLVPAVTSETRDLLRNADGIWSQALSTLGPLREFVSQHGLVENLAGTLDRSTSGIAGGAAGGLFATIRGFFSGIFSVLVVFAVTFYLVVSEDALKRLFHAFAPEAYQPYLVDLFTRIEKSIGGWVRGQLFLSAVIGLAVYVALKILGVKYALVLALAAGVAEVIPFVGPIVSALPALLVALTISPFKALLTGVMYLLIQQIENHVLVPKIMERATGVHPIVSIFAMLIGFKIAGVIGALLAIPVAMVVGIILADVFRMVRTQR